MNKKERTNTSIQFEVGLSVPIREYAHTTIKVTATDEQSAKTRAKKIAEGHNKLDDSNEHIIWYNSDDQYIGEEDGTLFYWNKMEIDFTDLVEETND